jgi:hypothetical protein
MTQAPRQGSAHTATHLERVHCEHVAGNRYACSGFFGDGSKLNVDVIVTADGKGFRLR